MTRFTFTRGLSYAATVAASERVAWTVDGVFRDRRFDASRGIVPPSWVGTEGLRFLDADDQLVLNHCRAFSYAHILRNFEEFVAPHVTAAAASDWHADRPHLRALFRFGEEEMKHQQLFLRAERVLEESCGHPFARFFDDAGTRVAKMTRNLLAYTPLARYLIILAVEWGTQRHYVETARAADLTDALYADLLKAHWVEEAQHTKTDTLEIAALAESMSEQELMAAFDDLLAITGLVDRTLVGQAKAEVETLADVRGHALSEGESAELQQTLHGSLGTIMAGVGIGHPTFARVARELSPEGAAKFGIA